MTVLNVAYRRWEVTLWPGIKRTMEHAFWLSLGVLVSYGISFMGAYQANSTVAVLIAALAGVVLPGIKRSIDTHLTIKDQLSQEAIAKQLAQNQVPVSTPSVAEIPTVKQPG